MSSDNADRAARRAALDAIENAFLEGDLEALRRSPCPRCGGPLLYSVAKVSRDAGAPPGRRVHAGTTIYCVGRCSTMLSHMDGYCPAWAEEVEDWDAFSAALRA